MNGILQEIEDCINTFNAHSNEDLAIDTIRIEFSKQYKLTALNEIGRWHKVTKSSNISAKLKKRLKDEEITSAYQLESENIFYINSNSDRPRYRKAVMVIFGLKQYTSTPPQKKLVKQIIGVLKDVSGVDICCDLTTQPNIHALQHYFKLTPYKSSYYVNDTGLMMIDRFIIYDKALKNALDRPLWRVEFTVTIPNSKHLYLPLDDIHSVINILRS